MILAVLGGYVFASYLFLKNPHLIHKKKRVPFICKHISHRGGAGESYENTLPAFQRAVTLGTDMLELDCQLTKDQLVVVSHDNNLLRSAGVDLNISDLDYDQLPLLKHQLPLDFDPGVEFCGSGRDEERRIPLLQDVFQLFPEMPINIDIKVDDDLLIREVDKLIAAHQRQHITVWGNISNTITLKCYSQNPQVCLLFSMQRVLQLLALFYTGLLPFCPIKESHLEIFMPSIFMRRIQGDQFSKSTPLLLKAMDFILMRPALFQHLHKRGIQTYVWVLNEEADFRRAFDLGVTGVMTDYPTRLLRFLDENPQYNTKSCFTYT